MVIKSSPSYLEVMQALSRHEYRTSMEIWEILAKNRNVGMSQIQNRLIPPILRDLVSEGYASSRKCERLSRPQLEARGGYGKPPEYILTEEGLRHRIESEPASTQGIEGILRPSESFH